MNLATDNCYIAVESREALVDWSSNAGRQAALVSGGLPYFLEIISGRGSPNRQLYTEPPERKGAPLSHPEQMVHAVSVCGQSAAEKRTLDRVSPMLNNLGTTSDPVKPRGKKGGVQ